MIPMTVDDKQFLVDFRHRRRTGRRPQLYGGSPLNGVTTCAIVGLRNWPPGGADSTLFSDASNELFVALGSAICVRADQFNRREGRRHAFHDAVNRCGILRDVADGLLAEYDRRWPQPKPGAPVPPKPKVKLSHGLQNELRVLAATGGPDADARRNEILSSIAPVASRSFPSE